MKRKNAFTLVELIVTIVILIILASIAFITLGDYPRDARDIVRKTDLQNIAKTLELYKMKNVDFPEPDNQLEVSTQSGWIEGEFGTGNYKLVKILNELPVDPTQDINYKYFLSNDGESFKLVANLENGEDYIVYGGAAKSTGSTVASSGNTNTVTGMCDFSGNYNFSGNCSFQ